MKYQIRLLAAFALAAAPSLVAGTLSYSQNPDPFKALEGTTGNIAFITLTNTDPLFIAYITSISYSNLIPGGGEADDQATNVALVAPNPTDQDPLRIGPGGTASIKLSWDAIDSIKDNDIDFGDWTAFFKVVFHLAGDPDSNLFPQAHLRVNDVPEPSPSYLIAAGAALLALGRYRRRAYNH